MGKLLYFVPRQAAEPREPRNPNELATIILFPGVRYERLGDPPPPLRRGTGKTNRPGKPRAFPINS
ncbi:MAG: hypothetical protein ABWY13_19385 [Mesorhizobium sp.]|jgi:hypothetical protein